MPYLIHRGSWTHPAAVRASLLFGLLVLPGSYTWGNGDKPIDILRKVILAQGNVTYSSVGTVTSFGPGGPKTTTQIVFRKSGGKERIKIQDLAGQTIWLRVCDGKTVWEHHMGRQDRIFIRTLPPAERLRDRELFNLKMLAANFTVTLVGTEMVAGRKAHRIRITKSFPRAVVLREVWIDQSKHIELKADSYDPEGRPIHSVVLNRVNFAPSFEPNTFQFEAPAGLQPHIIRPPTFVGTAEAAAQRAGFPAMPPRHIPPGFAIYPDMVTVTEVRGVTTLWYQYTNGLRQFSVFQRRVLPGDRVPGPGRGWTRTFRVGEYHFTIVGPLWPHEYEMIRASYYPAR